MTAGPGPEHYSFQPTSPSTLPSPSFPHHHTTPSPALAHNLPTLVPQLVRSVQDDSAPHFPHFSALPPPSYPTQATHPLPPPSYPPQATHPLPPSSYPPQDDLKTHSLPTAGPRVKTFPPYTLSSTIRSQDSPSSGPALVSSLPRLLAHEQNTATSPVPFFTPRQYVPITTPHPIVSSTPFFTGSSTPSSAASSPIVTSSTSPLTEFTSPVPGWSAYSSLPEAGKDFLQAVSPLSRDPPHPAPPTATPYHAVTLTALPQSDGDYQYTTPNSYVKVRP